MKTPIARLKRIHEREAVKLLQRVIDSEGLSLNPELAWALRLQTRLDRWERRGWRLERARRGKP